MTFLVFSLALFAMEDVPYSTPKTKSCGNHNLVGFSLFLILHDLKTFFLRSTFCVAHFGHSDLGFVVRLLKLIICSTSIFFWNQLLSH